MSIRTIHSKHNHGRGVPFRHCPLHLSLTKKSDRGLLNSLLSTLLLFVHGVPHEETSDERCEMKHLAEKFWELRGTSTVGPVWDRVKLPDGKNVAHTDLALWIYCKSFPF